MFHVWDTTGDGKDQILGLDSNQMPIDDKYNIPKSRKPATRQEAIQHEIEELVKRRDAAASLQVKKELNAEITKLFAQYQRLNL